MSDSCRHFSAVASVAVVVLACISVPAARATGSSLFRGESDVSQTTALAINPTRASARVCVCGCFGNPQVVAREGYCECLGDSWHTCTDFEGGLGFDKDPSPSRVSCCPDIIMSLGWTGYGYEFAPVSYHATTSGVCVVEGFVKSFAKKQKIATLPILCRPLAREVFNVLAEDSSARVDVDAGGNVFCISKGGKKKWISLNGISFRPGGAEDLMTLGSGVKSYSPNFQHHFQEASYVLAGDFCTVHGVVLVGDGSVLGVLPPQCRPGGGTLVFNALTNKGGSRVDVLANGTVNRVGGRLNATWISLTGIGFSTRLDSEALVLKDGVSNYGNGYATGSFVSTADFCVLSGLVKVAINITITQLPSRCRPKGRLVFNVNSGEETARVDVFGNGLVLWVAGNHDLGVVSLSGIHFATKLGSVGGNTSFLFRAR